jgi:hypothetical protein
MTDFWGQAVNVLEVAAPALASIVGGPLAGQGVSLIEKTLGLDPTGDPQAAATAIIGATPEQLIQLQADALALKQKFIDAGIQLEQDDVADRTSARAREEAVRDRTPTILAFGVTAGFFSLLALLAFHEIPSASRDLMNIMLGALGTAWAAIVSYYFGSSSGNARATELLGKSSPVQP